jgi:beta-mannosidase
MKQTQVDLCGAWELTCGNWQDKTVPAVLPGDNYSALLAAGEIPDPYYGRNEADVQWVRHCDWEFRREFDVPAELLNCDSVFLNIEQLDLFGTVYLNNKKVMDGDNMFTRYRPEAKPFLRPGRNSIRIRFRPVEPETAKIAAALPMPVPMTGCSQAAGLNLVRKVHCHGGWDWGITLMVSGVYGPLALRGVNLARIEHVHAEQRHEKNKVTVTAVAELSALENGRKEVRFLFNGETRTVRAALKKGGNRVTAVFEVKNPELWWPNGYGRAALYPLTVETGEQSETRDIGLRTLELVHEKDEYGRSMYFRINGVDIFCKGANWIPADALPSRQTPEALEDLLESARGAHMNMLRVWGGGQYESDEFYRLCDRKGLLVWQDMMFSCSLYPSTEEFIAAVRQELEFQIPRLRSHACLALWCGDNEVIGATGWYGGSDKRTLYLIHYDRLNRELARMAKKLDPSRVFWPSSPCGGPDNFNDGWHDDSCGDMHYWEVWHGAKDFNAYYSVKPRFCSEFGYQSFPSLETVAKYCPEEQFNVFSPVMDHHQKCRMGNAPIIAMFGQYFRMPESFAGFLYLSQVQQALAIKTGVEYWRTLKPRCMGTLYWQLNDNWPVASWSSLEYGGKWKQLHYHAKRFYAPALGVIAKVDGALRLFAVSDLPERLRVAAVAAVYDFDGRELRRFECAAALRPGESKCLKTFKDAELAGLDPDRCFIELSLEATGKVGSAHRHRNTYFFDVFKHCELQPAAVKTEVTEKDGVIKVALRTDKPAFFVMLDTPGIPGTFDDNSLTLLPGEPHRAVFTPRVRTTAKEVRKALTVTSLRDVYR